MSARYEKARAIAEAIANRWDKFGDTQGAQWLAERIENAIAAAEPMDDSALVTGLPMLALAGGRQWHVLGEDGARFKLVLAKEAPRSPIPTLTDRGHDPSA
jgi:hypothetical protein